MTATDKFYPNRVTIPKEIAMALDAILDYLWQDEQRNVEQAAPTAQDGHIFNAMQLVKAWLEGGETDVE